MTKIYLFFTAILLTNVVWAQVPQKMSYQAVVRDAANALKINQKVGIQISLLQGSVSGDAVYVETQAPTTNDNGLLSIEIGAGTVISGSLTTIDWSKGPYFIHTETDPTGGTDYTITGTSELLSVPYALHAQTAEKLTGTLTETDPLFSSSIASSITATDTAKWNQSNTTAGAQLDSAGIASMGYVAGPRADLTKLAPLASPTFTGTVSGIDKTMIGLTDVENTSDVDKPVSTATQTALDLKAPLADPTFTGTTTATTFSGDFNGTINTATTASTQSSGDSSTKVATTAFVAAAVRQPGTATGQITYWNGTVWDKLDPPSGNGSLRFQNGSLAWVLSGPVITSESTFSVAENQTAIGTVSAIDAVSYSVSGSELAITAEGGVLTFISAPDYETKSLYTATVTAINGTASTTQDIVVSITDVDDTAPEITSGTTGTNLAENSGAGQTVYTIAASDAVGVVGYAISGTDASLLSVNASTGVVSLTANPDYETKSSYSFIVTAVDEEGNISETTTVTFSITDVDDTAPKITSGTTGTNLAENSGAGQTVYTIAASDAVGVVGYAISGTDASLLSVNASTGVVSLTANPDYETKSSYSFIVTAVDEEGNISETTTVTFSITDVIEVGQAYQGGIVGHIFSEGELDGYSVGSKYVSGEVHGIIVAPSREENFLNFNDAQAAISNKTTNGYTDWFIPQILNCKRLSANRIAIGGFGYQYYWSSSVYYRSAEGYIMQCIDLDNGQEGEYLETFEMAVIGIRFF